MLCIFFPIRLYSRSISSRLIMRDWYRFAAS